LATAYRGYKNEDGDYEAYLSGQCVNGNYFVYPDWDNSSSDEWSTTAADSTTTSEWTHTDFRQQKHSPRFAARKGIALARGEDPRTLCTSQLEANCGTEPPPFDARCDGDFAAVCDAFLAKRRAIDTACGGVRTEYHDNVDRYQCCNSDDNYPAQEGAFYDCVAAIVVPTADTDDQASCVAASNAYWNCESQFGWDNSSSGTWETSWATGTCVGTDSNGTATATSTWGTSSNLNSTTSSFDSTATGTSSGTTSSTQDDDDDEDEDHDDDFVDCNVRRGEPNGCALGGLQGGSFYALLGAFLVFGPYRRQARSKSKR
jgi:hypothetical protein